MSTILPDAPPTEWTIADVQARLAGFPADRIRVYPTPGTATEQDLLAAEARSNRICELIDGTLVEKPMASLESVLALVLSHFLHLYLDTHNLGVLAGEAGLLRILPGQIRAPDVSFIRWDRFAGRQLPKAAIFAVAPTWPWRSSRQATRPKKWIASSATISSRACGWSGTSSPRPARHALIRPSMRGPRSHAMVRCLAAKFCPALICRLPSYSPASKGQRTVASS